jgi:hypothetical protein
MDLVAVAVITALSVFPMGMLVGYWVRDRISRERKTRYWVDRWEREMTVAREREAAAAATLAPNDDRKDMTE